MPQSEQPISASNSNSSTPQIGYTHESGQSVDDSGAQTTAVENSSTTHVPLSAHRNPHHGHNSFYEKQRQIQQEQGIASERESLASAVDDDDDGDDLDGEIVEKNADQLFTTANARPQRAEKLSRESSVSGVGSFYTQQSAESGTNSRTSNLSYVSDVNLPFDQWKEAKLARLNMIPLERLLLKQVERYGFNMFDSLEPEDQLEVDNLRREQGFSFEEGVLYRFNSKRGLKLPEAGALTPNSSYQPSPAQTLSPFELSAPQLSPMSVQGSTVVPVGPNMNTISPMSTQSTLSTQSLPFMTPQEPVFDQPNEHTPFYLDAHDKYVSSMGEEGHIRLSIMLSEQEEKCGLNMFDAMRTADHATLHALIERGALFEEAMLQIYKIKYPMYMNPRAQPMSTSAAINLNANMGSMNLGVNPVLPLNQSNFPMNATMPMMYPTSIPRPTMVPYLDPATGLVVMVPTMTPQMTPQMMSMPMMQVPNMMMVPGQQMGMMPMMAADQQYPHHPHHAPRNSSKSRSHHDRDHHHQHHHGHDEHHGKHLKRPPSQRQSLSRQGSGKSHGGHHDGHHSHNSSHHSLSHHNSHPNMHMVSHSSSFQQLPSFPGSQPPSRIPSRQSMMSRSNSNASQSRRVSFSRSNSGTEATGRKTPTLEPSRQESPTRRQMEHR
jgi:hypothetical protein